MDKGKPKGGDKRKSPRKKSYSLVSFVEKEGKSDAGPAAIGRTLNIGAGGIRLESLEPMEKGHKLDMEIAVGDRVFSILGEVIYCQPMQDGMYAVGVRFQESREDFTEKLG